MKTALRCGHLIDGSGAPARKDAVVLVEGEKILAVGGAEVLQGEVKLIDLSDKWVTPGLIDLHNHITVSGDALLIPDANPQIGLLRAAKTMDMLIRAGVTTVREAGAPHGYSFTAKEALAKGIITGPRLLISGVPLAMTGGHGWPMALEVDGADEARKGARQQIKRGAEWIKLLATGGVVTPGEALGAPQMTVEEMTAACEEAHKAGRRVLAHAMGPIGIRWALQAGVDTIEHGIWFGDEEIELMIQHDVYLVPTFSVSYTQATHGRELGMPQHVIDKASQAAEQMFLCTERAAQAGVKIAMGTDAGGPGVNHSMVALELELMKLSGTCRTNMAVIESATSKAADALGMADVLGSITPGKLADILALDADPLEELDAFRKVNLVMKGGEVLVRSTSAA